MTIPHIKVTDTMLNKYTIDAKVAILEQMGIEPDQTDGVETWEDPFYRTAYYWFDVDFIFDIKFYMTFDSCIPDYTFTFYFTIPCTLEESPLHFTSLFINQKVMCFSENRIRCII